MTSMIYPILFAFLYVSPLVTVECFIINRVSYSFLKESSSLEYKTKPYDEKDGLITSIPKFPSVPDHIKNIFSATSLKEYENLLKVHQEKLIVTRFYMTNCKACLAMTPSFYRLVRSKPDVIFVDIPITMENSNLHLQLGVETVPFAHINHPIFGLVEERKISRKHWDEFESIVQSYVDGECVLVNDDCSNPYTIELKLDPNYF